LTRLTQRAAALLLVTAALLPRAGASEVVDRIVASVNQQVVLESEIQASIAYQCLMNHTPRTALTAEERRAVLDRLIEQKLLRQQMRDAKFSAASSQDVLHRVEELKQELNSSGKTAGTQPLWSTELEKYGLTEADVEQEIGLEIELLRFVDARFRPAIRIDDAKIESYYTKVLLPQLSASGARPPKLEEVAERIREVLVQQRINEELANWLRNLREQSTIKIR